MLSNSDLSALLCSRICHDLISPIGAIGNGVELLMLDENGPRIELSLISESASSANARIRFFRIAFGAAGDENQIVSKEELVSIINDLKRGSRTNVTWLASGGVNRPEAKMILLAFMCVDSAMPHGGEISISKHGENWCVHGMAGAGRLRILSALWGMLCDTDKKVDQIEAADVHFAVLTKELKDQKIKANVKIGDAEILLFI